MGELVAVRSQFDLAGKVALVTGAGNGIGRQTALTLAQLGARVIASDIDVAGLDNLTARLDIRRVEHDVTSVDAWACVIDGVDRIEGRLDTLVNNAGIIVNKPFLETSLAELQSLLRVNVESVWIGMQAAIPLMTETSSGRTGPDKAGASIVNMSSIFGQIAGPQHAAYGASKGAVRLLTKGVAIELARNGSGIRVNSVHPGPIDTDLGTIGVRDRVASGIFPDIDTGKALLAQNFPMGRWGQVGDIADAIAFLASDASRFMTGSEITIDGGYTTI